jgi:hypothetical protein
MCNPSCLTHIYNNVYYLMQEYEHRSGRKDGVDSEDEVKLEDA